MTRGLRLTLCLLATYGIGVAQTEGLDLPAASLALPIKPDWYRQMQEALIDTFAAALGERFTNDMELAWRSAFSQICDRMMEVAGHKT